MDRFPYETNIEQPCDICGEFIDFCECPECPVCHEIGRMACMDEHGLVVRGITKADIAARLEADRKENEAVDQERYEAYIADQRNKIDTDKKS